MTDKGSGPATRPSLLLRIQDRTDRASWQTFVDVYGPLVHRYGRACGLQDADAAEVMQEVLLRVSTAIDKFAYDPRQGRFRDWLYTVTRNTLIIFQKKKAREVQASGSTDQADRLSHVASAEQDSLWTEAYHQHILQTALTRIQPHFEEPTWRAFELVWLQDRSPEEVARATGQTADWVHMVKSRVLKRLREEILELAEDEALYVR